MCECGFPGKLGREKLERYLSFEPGVLGLIHHTHAATADVLNHLIMGENPAHPVSAEVKK
jgi:hypothetical protein